MYGPNFSACQHPALALAASGRGLAAGDLAQFGIVPRGHAADIISQIIVDRG